MSNIRRVAELAGVSVATVSRTLKNPDVVAPATRERVQAAVAAANYRPNGMAVQFRSRRTGNLVVLVPLIANSFFARVIAGIQQAAQAAGYRVLLCDTAGDERREREYAELVYARQADGVIQLRAFDPFAGQGDIPPVVNACEVLAEHTWPKVRLDNRAAARCLTEHLLALGHRRIALIKGPEDSPLTLERLAGYQEALTQAGIALDPGLLHEGDFTLAAGAAAAKALLTLPERPTALFCCSDEMAIGALQILRRSGLRVPEDISLAGFDDIAFAAYTEPPLTTIAQPAEAFGQRAVAMLLEVLNGGTPAAREVVLPFELKVRGSTGVCG
ncbi:LacI family DNA-binding transcriptional regulator [Pseudomonas sp. JBR1]|uniref:LacI family DNA-binding transcriptional regulator n=1 Tax=Pseudomonas sp. JBR1 TaxID=3020907 RepID=UPI002304E607|nr:LacI family DNA-binding transcriptional regulator [Pseudomonas sp. JBR1]WCE09850.1 LacI family DNA-binding transcriptional regulator [Pseudomonas sp. JBR1]